MSKAKGLKIIKVWKGLFRNKKALKEKQELLSELNRLEELEALMKDHVRK